MEETVVVRRRAGSDEYALADDPNSEGALRVSQAVWLQYAAARRALSKAHGALEEDIGRLINCDQQEEEG